MPSGELTKRDLPIEVDSKREPKESLLSACLGNDDDDDDDDDDGGINIHIFPVVYLAKTYIGL